MPTPPPAIDLLEPFESSAGLDDHDNPWKEAIEGAFQDFLAFYFPQAHDGIDWTQGHVFLDKELRQVVRDADSGKKFVDLLAQVTAADGSPQWLYVHVEVQTQRDTQFPRRMFTYNHRLMDRWGQAVASLAVLADTSPTWRPDAFRSEVLGCSHHMRFPIAKLLDFEPQLAELPTSTNPFALVTAAHLMTLRTRHDATRRFAAKRQLVMLLYRRGWERQRVIDLFAVLDWMMRLPAPLERTLWQDIETHERETAMKYVTSFERFAIEREVARGHQAGMQQGLEQGMERGLERGRIETLRRQLTRRFGPLSEACEARLNAATLQQLDVWTDRVLDAPSLSAVLEGN